jgi:3-hydroxyacyl-[acyl-carrier-protein] dehydratase
VLLNNLFTLKNQNSSPGAVRAVLSIQKDHEIFKGHFPGRPVVPGVCMMQVIKELVEVETNRNLRLAAAANMKFLSIIDPEENNQLDAEVTYDDKDGHLGINASLFAGAVTFFKLKAILVSA